MLAQFTRHLVQQLGLLVGGGLAPVPARSARRRNRAPGVGGGAVWHLVDNLFGGGVVYGECPRPLSAFTRSPLISICGISFAPWCF